MKKKKRSAPTDYETEEDVLKAAEIQSMSPVDSRLELLDPNPNIHLLFSIFDNQFFWGKLQAVEVKWSPRMTQCAGICRYQTRSGFCTIGLSRPLLALRPRKDLVETLLHEMIHAYLFVTHNNRDRDGHGPEFHKHMFRINGETGAGISVYHTFHEEVRAQKVHVWKCQGPCKDRPPFFGFVRRSMNRAPGPHDLWHLQHLQSCGGTFVKVLEPPGFKSKKKGEKKERVPDAAVKATPKITSMFEKSPVKTSPFSTLPSTFKPFSGTGFKLGSNNPPATLKTLQIPKSQSIPSQKATKTQTHSPIKISSPSKIPTKDISSYFNKSSTSILSMSDDDDDLLILTPPTKKRKAVSEPGSSANPNKKPKLFGDASLECPVCNKTGFADINIHVNLCLNKQFENAAHEPSEQSKTGPLVLDSDHSKTKLLVLDESIEEIPTSSVNKPSTSPGKAKACLICGKVVPTSMSLHLVICIASIPADSDDEDLLIRTADDIKPNIKQTAGDIKPNIKQNETKPTIASPNVSPADRKALPCDAGIPQHQTVRDENVITIEDPVLLVPCPICSLPIRETTINSHLDRCLVSGFS